MTEYDDKEKTPAEPMRGRETHGETLFRLGVFLLAALMFTALFLVGGSLSKITSEGTIENLTLNMAGFDVTLEEASDYTAGDTYDDNSLQLVVCAFTVINNSALPITCDVEIRIEITASKTMPAGLNYYLHDQDGNHEPIGAHEEGTTEFTYSLDAFSLEGGSNSERTYVVYADFTEMNPMEYVDMTFYPYVDVTATQIKEV